MNENTKAAGSVIAGLTAVVGIAIAIQSNIEQNQVRELQHKAIEDAKINQGAEATEAALRAQAMESARQAAAEKAANDAAIERDPKTQALRALEAEDLRAARRSGNKADGAQPPLVR
jgi:hypothetical protein